MEASFRSSQELVASILLAEQVRNPSTMRERKSHLEGRSACSGSWSPADGQAEDGVYMQADDEEEKGATL